MQTLLIFDDDADKIDLGNEVLAALNHKDGTRRPKSAGTSKGTWELGFSQRMNSLTSATAFLMKLQAVDSPLLLLDIEIKPGDVEKSAARWRAKAASLVEKCVRPDQKKLFKDEISRLEKVYGKPVDYQLSLTLLAYARVRGICVITISTKQNPRDQIFNSHKADTVGVPFIANWDQAWKQWTKNKISIVRGIADKVREEWEKWNGMMEQRIWPAEAIEAPGWFSGGSSPHRVVPHGSDNEKCNGAAYTQRIKQYVETVTKTNLSKNWKPLPRCHDALKRLVGACAKAHVKTGNGYVPQLNTVALMAASWDPTASKWLSSFEWRATEALMCETASQKQLRQVILALGGEDGLFMKLLPKEGDPKVSNLKSITTKKNRLILTFTFDLSADKNGGKRGIKQLFNAERGKGVGVKSRDAINETSRSLIDVWQKLAIHENRMIDIEVTNSDIIFKTKATREN